MMIKVHRYISVSSTQEANNIYISNHLKISSRDWFRCAVCILFCEFGDIYVLSAAVKLVNE